MKALKVVLVLAATVTGLYYVRTVSPPLGIILGLVIAGMVTFALYYWLALKK